MRTPALLLVVTLLAGCGFALRGANVLPENLRDLYLVAPTELRSQVEVFLEGSRTRLVERRDAASVVLSMVKPRYDRRVLSVDPTTGKEREFELSYTVDVSATARDGSPLLTPQPVTLLRDYVFDRDALIGASREEGVLRDEMRRDAVRQVLLRLRAAAGHAG